MSKRTETSPNGPDKRTIPELLRGVSHKFREAVRQQRKTDAAPEMRTKDVEPFDKK